jgi:hypothetical protein
MASEHSPVQVDYLHVCDYAFRAENGKPGIIGIFDYISSVTFPTTHAYMCVAVQFRGQPGHVATIRLVIESQAGEKVFDMPEQKIAFSDTGGAFFNANLLGLTFNAPGRYSVVAMAQGAVLATQSLQLKKIEARAA